MPTEERKEKLKTAPPTPEPEAVNEESAPEEPGTGNWREAFRAAFDRARRQQKPVESRQELGRDKSKSLFLLVGVCVVLLLLFFGVFSHPKKKIALRNPYFKYSAGVTLALLLLAIVCAKQWIDNRRTLWITAEMMADLYNHDLYSRDVAEKAIRKYNDHIERCNRAIEAGQHGLAEQSADSDHALCNEKLTRVTAERDEYLRQLNQIQTTLKTKEQTVAELSLRVDGISMKSAGNGAVGPSVELSTSDPNVVRHINNLQEQIYAERETNKRLKGA